MLPKAETMRKYTPCAQAKTMPVKSIIPQLPNSQKTELPRSYRKGSKILKSPVKLSSGNSVCRQAVLPAKKQTDGKRHQRRGYHGKHLICAEHIGIKNDDRRICKRNISQAGTACRKNCISFCSFFFNICQRYSFSIGEYNRKYPSTTKSV